MDFTLLRYSKANNSSQSLFFAKGMVGDSSPKFFCHVIEDDDQGAKGDKRIPAGSYVLKIHNAVTPKTEFFRKAMPWFEFFIEVTGIPGFDLVFVHPGNDQQDTEGCLLLNDVMGNNSIQKAKEGSLSQQACKRFYDLVYPRLKAGEKITITIKDEVALSPVI